MWDWYDTMNSEPPDYQDIPSHYLAKNMGSYSAEYRLSETIREFDKLSGAMTDMAHELGRLVKVIEVQGEFIEKIADILQLDNITTKYP